MEEPKPIVIIDDEKHATVAMRLTLKSSGIELPMKVFTSSSEALEWLKENEPALVLLDIGMANIDGIEILKRLKENLYPNVQVIMITAELDLEKAILCMQLGAYDFVTKPVNKERLLASIRKSLELVDRETEIKRLRDSLFGPSVDMTSVKNVITNDERMLQIFNYLKAVVPSKSPILISGETGTGKEVAARLLHHFYPTDVPFVACNVAGLDDQLFSDTLFGHVKGAYTGANSSRGGLVEKAEGGILFLDEIGDLSIASQVKLLRLLQESEYTPLGSDTPLKCNIRIIAATHRDLQERMNDGTFRSDLYYRLVTHRVELPALRHRKTDIPLLFDYFIGETCKELHCKPPTYSKPLLMMLQSYEFPGNIRELRAMVQDAVTKATDGVLKKSSFSDKLEFSEDLGFLASEDELEEPTACVVDFNTFLQNCEELPTLDSAKVEIILEALKRTNNNQSNAAKLLGLTRQSLNQWVKKNIDKID